LKVQHIISTESGGAFVAMNMIVKQIDRAAKTRGQFVEQEVTYLNDYFGKIVNRIERRVMTNKPHRLKRLPIHLNLFPTRLDVTDKINADIIHIHWVVNSGLSISQLIKLSQNKTLVITLHDLNLVTGGCHTPINCLNYKENCENCPVSNGWFGRKTVRYRRDRIDELLAHAYVCCPSKYVYKYVIAPNKYFIPNPVMISNEVNKIIDRNIDILFFLDKKNWFLKGYDKACIRIKEYLEEGLKIGVIGDLYLDKRFEESVENFGFVDREYLLRILLKTKKIYIGSRFETFSLLAHEAVKSGCEIEHDEITAVTELVERHDAKNTDLHHHKSEGYFSLYNDILSK
jgi:hypothetical protein